MKLNHLKRKRRKGLTLIEVTLVISVILGLITILFRGVEVYKKGSDRAFCIQNIARVQKAMRSWSNLNGYRAGEAAANMQSELIGPSKFLNLTPVCPAEGTYSFGPDVIPAAGVAYMNCSISDHFPPNTSGW